MFQFCILPVLGLNMHNNRVGMSNNLPICFKNWKWQIIYLWSRTKIDRIYLAINLELSLFHKWHKISVNITNRQNKTKVCFCYSIAYCISISHLPCGRSESSPNCSSSRIKSEFGGRYVLSRALRATLHVWASSGRIEKQTGTIQEAKQHITIPPVI